MNVVLFEPEIPPNTGNIGRLCHATGSALHLIEPLGFSLEDKALRRAGLDYWCELSPTLWPSLELFLESVPSGNSVYYLTTKSDRVYWDAKFKKGDYLVFGPETRGLPKALLESNVGSCLTIPQVKGRSLNLSTAVGIVLFEGIRQAWATSPA